MGPNGQLRLCMGICAQVRKGQMSTATIYAHHLDAANDEATGVIGGEEAGVPKYWDFSVEIARAGSAPWRRRSRIARAAPPG